MRGLLFKLCSDHSFKLHFSILYFDLLIISLPIAFFSIFQLLDCNRTARCHYDTLDSSGTPQSPTGGPRHYRLRLLAQKKSTVPSRPLPVPYGFRFGGFGRSHGQTLCLQLLVPSGYIEQDPATETPVLSDVCCPASETGPAAPIKMHVQMRHQELKGDFRCDQLLEAEREEARRCGIASSQNPSLIGTLRHTTHSCY